MYIKNLIKTVILIFLTASSAFAVPDLAQKVKTWQTSKGAKVYFYQTSQLPIIDIKIAFDAGSSRDGKAYGLANFTSNMLDQGANHYDANTIAQKFGDLGTVFETSTDRDSTLIHLRSLSKSTVFSPALELFTTVLSKPIFPDHAFLRMQRNLGNAIQAKLQNPGTIATDNFFRAIYKDYPYAHPVIGTSDSVMHITPSNLTEFYQRYYVNQNAVIAIVGDVNLTQAQTIANAISNALPAGEKAPPLQSPAANSKADVITIKYPAVQTAIRLGQIGITRDNPDYVPLIVGNYILGGDSSSRLFRMVREQHGLTYGIGSALVPYAQNGPFIVYLETQTSQTQNAIDITEQVIKKFAASGIDETELSLAKNYLSGSLPMQLASNSQIASYLVLVGRYNLAVDYLPDLIEKIKNTSVAEVNAAIRKHIFPEQMVLVKVG